MTDSSLHGKNHAAVVAFPAGDDVLVETGAIARLLASPGTRFFLTLAESREGIPSRFRM
jgi:hypothetical protein